MDCSIKLPTREITVTQAFQVLHRQTLKFEIVAFAVSCIDFMKLLSID